MAVTFFIKQALAGKTIGRAFFNEAVRKNCAGLSGRVLDLAGGTAPSYIPLLPKGIDLVRTDVKASLGVTKVDIDAPLPFSENSFNAVLFFNALYLADNPAVLAREIHRVLRPGGVWHIVSPFIANEMPEPHDYVRFTAEGLERLCAGAGFSQIKIYRMGERASAATQLLHPFFLFSIIRAFVFPLALLMDAYIPQSVRTSHPTPIGYFVRAMK